MGGLRNAARQSRRSTPALDSLFQQSGGFQPTQPGDPDFSLSATPGSQLQFPAAAAESRVYDVQTRAQNQLSEAAAAGFDINAPQYRQLTQAAQEGTTDHKRSLGESLLGWVGAPFETVNLLIQDMISPQDDASVGDYANALWGGIEDDNEFRERTGFDPQSFSETLTRFGWEPAEEFGAEAVLRGIVDFGGSLLIDPLTYVTGGLAGLGRKTAVAAGRSMQSGVIESVMRFSSKFDNLDEFGNVAAHVVENANMSGYAKYLAKTHRQTLDEFTEVMASHVDEIARGDMNSDVVKDLVRYLKPDGKDDLYRLYTDKFEELALAQRIGREVIQPLAQRNFSAINTLALEELPVWARGGLRLGLPAFSARFADVAIEVPGTRGLGRKLAGDPLREVSTRLKNSSRAYQKIASSLSSGRMSFDSYRPILNGLRDGTLEPWQFHIASTAMDNIHNQAYRQAMTASFHHHAQLLGEAADKFGEERSSVYRTLLERMELSGDDAAMMHQAEELMAGLEGQAIPESALGGVPLELDKAINDAATFMRETYDDLHSKMGALDPSFKQRYVDGYTPHVSSDDGRSILKAFADKGAAVPRRDWVDAAERGEPGKALLVRILNAVGGGGMAETNLGSSRFAREREVGRVQAQLLADDGPILLDESWLKDSLLKQNAVRPVGAYGEVATDVLESRYVSVAQLNEWLEGAIRENADEYGIVLPKGWDGKVFKENPLEVAGEYVSAMDDAIKQWTMIDAMKMAGLVTRHSTAVDVQDVLQKMMGNVNRIAKKVPVEVGPREQFISDISENPARFAYHSTEADKAEKILKSSQKSGGIYADREAAEKFVRHGKDGEVIGSGTRKILVYDKEEFPPSIRNPLERSGEIGDVRGVPSGVIKPIGSYDPAKGLQSFEPAQRTASILEGKANLVEGIPLKVVSGMNRSGMDVKNVGSAKKLFQTLESMTQKTFRAIRNTELAGLPDMTDPGLHADLDNLIVKFVVDPTMDKNAQAVAREKALMHLDRLFIKGKLKGRLDHETMVELAKNAPDEGTSDLLYKYYRNKMASLSEPVKEYLGSNPGEFTGTTVLADEFFEAFNEFISDYSAYRTTGGSLVDGGRQAKMLADHNSEFVTRLKDLRAAARTLGENGYEEAAAVMREVSDVTGVMDLPNYIAPHSVGLAGPAIESMQIQRDIALWLKNVARNTASVYTPEGVAAAKIATKELLRTWRALATLPRPAFHIRNATGAAWMNMVAGVRGETYKRVGLNAQKWRKALREGAADPYEVLDEDIRDAWRAMNDNDVLSGFVSSEFRAPLTGAEKKERLSWLKVWDPDDFVLTRVGGRTMESIEDVARAALFLEYYRPGQEGSDILAREMVKAIHFDYSDLTPWETKIKSFVPFFVWTRRNLPRQLEMMVERPGVIQRYKHLMQSMNDNLGGNDDEGMPTGDLFSAYAAGTNFYVNPGTPFWGRVMIDPDLPVTDLLNIPNPNPPELLEFANDLLGPHIGTLININEQREFGDVNAPQPLAAILKGLAAVGLYDETIDGDVRVPFWMRTVQETALPFTRDIVDPITGGPTDPNRQQRLGIAQEDTGIEASLKTLLGTLGRGVGVKFNTPVDVRSSTARTQDELDRVIAALREQGQLPTTESSGSALDTLLG